MWCHLQKKKQYKLRSDEALDLMAEYHKYRQAYAFGDKMNHDTDTHLFAIQCKGEKHPLPQERSQKKQIKDLQSKMHEFYDKYNE